MARMSSMGERAKYNAAGAAARTGEDAQVDALGEGLAAIAYALLEVADAIREQTEAQQQ